MFVAFQPCPVLLEVLAVVNLKDSTKADTVMAVTFNLICIEDALA